MKIREITVSAVLIAAALTIFIIESHIPPLVPLYGVKPGFANIITLVTLSLWNRQKSFYILFLRIIIASVVTGSGIAVLYSLSGGFFCFAAMIVMQKITGGKHMPAISMVGGVFHNIGQLLTAAVVLGSTSVFVYFPILVSSGIAAGFFTGIIAGVCVKNKYIKRLFAELKK